MDNKDILSFKNGKGNKILWNFRTRQFGNP